MSQRQASYRTRAPRVSEHDEQSSFFTRARLQFRGRGDFYERLLFSVPNGMWAGGSNPYALVAKFKAEGMGAGVSDILYLQPRGEYAYLAIEMKAADKRTSKGAVSDEQMEFLEEVNAAGGMGEVCYGADEAMEIFERYMSMSAG